MPVLPAKAFRSAPLALAVLLALAVAAAAADLHVAPGGRPGASGSADDPLASIQAALGRAMPGDTVRLAAGRYLQDVRSVRSGEENRPIVIEGPADAVVSGGGEDRVVEINHDFIELRGFTVDGRHAPAEAAESYRDKLVYVIGTEPGDGVTGLRIIGMTFRNGGGECLRLRYQAHRNEVAGSFFERCGVHDFGFGAGGKNGEAIYIGTAPEQLGGRGAPDDAVDRSDENWIHDNRFDTQGNECVDIKEGSSGNIVERNICTGQLDPESGGFDSRGSGNVFRFNLSYGNHGAGLRLGGDEATDGTGNDVHGNTFRDNRRGAIRFQRTPQGMVCENIVEGSEAAAGNFGKEYDPTVACSDPLATAAGRAAAAGARADEREEADREGGPPMTCRTPGRQCLIGRLEGDDRDRIKVFDASDVRLREKHLRVPAALDGAAKPVDLGALAGRTVHIEYDRLDDKVLENATLIGEVVR